MSIPNYVHTVGNECLASIPGVNDYVASKSGKIYSLISNKFLIPQPYGRLYPTVKIKGVHKPIHRLIAKAFHTNVDNKPCVNHIDGNKHNSRASNLEWCTYSENERHSYRVLGKKPNKTGKGKLGGLHSCSLRVKQYSIDNVFIKEWDSISDAARHYAISPAMITRVCKGERSKTKNFIWKYSNGVGRN